MAHWCAENEPSRVHFKKEVEAPSGLVLAWADRPVLPSCVTISLLPVYHSSVFFFFFFFLCMIFLCEYFTFWRVGEREKTPTGFVAVIISGSCYSYSAIFFSAPRRPVRMKINVFLKSLISSRNRLTVHVNILQEHFECPKTRATLLL
jgi:hypothetical protein